MVNQSKSSPTADIKARPLAEAMAARLLAAGIDTIFGIPGTHVIELYRGFDALDVATVTPRHEQGVGFAATAWGQIRGVPGVAVTTSGPGLLNVLAAAATAFCESRPLIVLSPGTPTGSSSARVGMLHETKSPIGASGAVMKWSARAESAADAMRLLDRAFETQLERPGPVHIEIPLDLFTEPIEWEITPTAAPMTAPLDQDAVASAASLLGDAVRPRILVGGGAIGAESEVRALAERLGAPVATTINGTGVLDESHPLALGAELRLASLHRDIEAADVLLIVGSRIAEAEFWSGPFAPTGSVIRIDIDSEQIAIGPETNVAIVSRAKPALEALLDQIGREGEFKHVELDSLRASIREEAANLGGSTLRLAERIEAWIPAGAVVSMDSSQICYLGMNTAIESRVPKRLLQAATYSPLGMALPGAIGAAVAEPDRKAWCVTGDGALMFSVQELITAAEESLDLTLVVVDNGGYQEIAENMVDAGIRPQGVKLTQPDWVKLAESLGAKAIELDADSDSDAFAAAGRFANEAGLRVVRVRQEMS